MPKPVFYRQPNRRRRVFTLVGLAMLAALAVYLLRGDGEDDSITADSAAPVDEEPVEHVHGLGVAEGDASLYVATHGGLFRIDDTGDASLVGEHRYDLMGFTVVDADNFLASGHPDVPGIRDGLPGRLGVIESTDGGGTWEPIALTGEVDLHALAYTDGRAYAVDAMSGQLFVSDDLRNWIPRGELPAVALTVDPDNRDVVVAATQEGLQRSGDGGATWTAVAGPLLRLVAWDRGSGLWGVTADGAVHQYDPSTEEWLPLRPLSGEPQAVTSRGGRRYVAVVEDGRTVVYRSDGDDWSVLFDGA